MPIVINHNINPDHGVINGTYGTVHSVHFPPTTRFRLVRDSGTGVKVLVPSAQPSVVMLKLNRQGLFPKIPLHHLREDDPDDVYPVFPIRSRGESEIELTPALGGISRTVKLSLNQFPFVAAIASTVYKIQGETLDSLVVADWKANGKGKLNTAQQGYIVVSRVISRNAFFSLRPLTERDIVFFRTDSATFAEDMRLDSCFLDFVSSADVIGLFQPRDYEFLHVSVLADTLRKGEHLGPNHLVKA